MLSEHFAKQYYWKELLQPYLLEHGLQFEDTILISAIVKHRSYIAFVYVSHTEDPPPSNRIHWFSDWIRIHVSFHEDELRFHMLPVHFRKEIQNFAQGIPILDKRQTYFGAKDCSLSIE